MNKLKERFDKIVNETNASVYIELETSYECAKEAKELAIEFSKYYTEYLMKS